MEELFTLFLDNIFAWNFLLDNFFLFLGAEEHASWLNIFPDMICSYAQIERQNIPNNQRNLDTDVPGCKELTWLYKDHAELLSMVHKELLLGNIVLKKEVADLEVGGPDFFLLLRILLRILLSIEVVLVGAEHDLASKLLM